MSSADGPAGTAPGGPGGPVDPGRPGGLDGAARLQALRRTDLLDTPQDAAFDRYARLLSRVVGVPVALLSLVEDDRQFFKSVVGLAEPWATRRQTGLSHSFCQHVVTADAPFAVHDARSDARVEGNQAIADLGVVAYLGAPVHGPGGQPIGALCAIDHVPRDWTEEDVTLLVELAQVTSELIAMRTAAAERRSAVVDLSHRLRTGLTALRLNAEEVAAVLEPAAGGSAAALVAGLEAQSQVLDEALAQLTGGALGHEQEVDVAVVVAEVAARAAARGRQVTAAGPHEHGSALVRAGAADVARLLDGTVAVLAGGDRSVSLSVLPGAGAVRVRLQGSGQGLSEDEVHALSGRSDSAADAEGTLAELATRRLGARVVVVGTAPPTVDVLMPRGQGSSGGPACERR